MKKNLILLLFVMLASSVFAIKNRYGMTLTADGDAYTVNNASSYLLFLPDGYDHLPEDAYELWEGYENVYIYDEDYAHCETKVYTFKQYDDYTLTLEVDIPSGTKVGDGPYPFIMWVHGGGWSGGSTGAFVNQSLYLASRGIAGVRISYSLSGNGGKFDMAMEDIDDAFAFVRDSAETWGLDMSRYGFGGGSAGTPLSSLAAFYQNNSDSCKVYIGCNGIYDFDHNRTGSFCNENSSPAYLSNYDDLTEVSAIAHIPDDVNKIPQTLLLHGTADNTISYLQSTTFVDAINNAGGTAAVKLYDYYVHGFFNRGTSDAFEDVILEMYNFAYQAFGLEYVSYATDFEADITEGYMPLTIQFTSLDTHDVSTWAWDFDNDGTVDSYEENPSYTYESAGVYTVKLTTTNAEGAFYKTRKNYITVIDPNPPVRFLETFENADFDRPSEGITVNGMAGTSYFASKYVTSSNNITMQSIDGSRSLLLRSWSNLQGYVEWELDNGIDSLSVAILKGYDKDDGTAALRVTVGAQSWDMDADRSEPNLFEINNMGISGPCVLRLSAIEGKMPVAIDNVAWRSYDEQASALDLLPQNKLRLYPNPVKDVLKVSLDASGESTLELLSLNGRSLLTQTFESSTMLDLSFLSSGLYILKLNNTFYTKVLVE